MARKRIKGTKYNKVTKQQKYIFLHLCIAEQKSIHEVIKTPFRLPSTQAYITQLPKPYSSSTKKTTKTTTPSQSILQKKIRPSPKPPEPLIPPYLFHSKTTAPPILAFR